jgi:phosphohistidine phosphatase
MKTLTLLRHAKSGWDDPVARDFDRPLNARGEQAARLIGRQLRTLGLEFDYVVASPALRVVETLEHFAQGYGELPPTQWDRRIYLASLAALLELVQQLPASVRRVLLIGHNPGLEDLTLLLTPADGSDVRRAAEAKYPTATIAELHFAITDWHMVGTDQAVLHRFIRPRDLDPNLGPDD